MFCRKVFLKISKKIHRKTPVQEFGFNKAVGLRPSTLLKKRLWHMCFPVNFQKHLFFKEHFQWLFLPAQETETEQLESCGATKFITTGLMITLKRNYLFEFHLPNTLLYFHFQNMTRLHFHQLSFITLIHN